MWIVVLIISAVIVWLVMTYNRLQNDMQSIREQLSNLQASLRKRVDLANQIVDIAQGYGEHEKLAHLSVSKSNQAMESMMALSQAFPDLKANQTYQTLMTQLEGLEESILQRRERYNASVRHYNSYRNRVPTIFVAQKLSFAVAPYYELEDPNFMEKVKLFERDDSEALQQLIESGGKSVTQTLQNSKTKLQQQLGEMQHKSKPDHSNTDNSKETTVAATTIAKHPQSNELDRVSDTSDQPSTQQQDTNDQTVDKPTV